MFQSVEDFLRKANDSKEDARQRIGKEISPLLEDPGLIGITPALLESINTLVEKHGDETFRQIALFCLGQWVQVHADRLEQHTMNLAMEAGMLTVNDMSKLCTAVEIVGGVGSFGNDEGWRKMLKESMSQSILELCEEDNIDLDSYFGEKA